MVAWGQPAREFQNNTQDLGLTVFVIVVLFVVIFVILLVVVA